MTWNPLAGPLTDPWPGLSLDEVDASDMTDNITANFNALQAVVAAVPPFFSAATSGAQSIANTTFTTLTGWTAAYDSASGLSGGSTYFLNKIGVWRMTAVVNFNGSATGRRIISCLTAGTGAAIFDGVSQIETVAGANGACAVGVWHINVTTSGTGSVAVQAWQSSGGALSVSSAINNKWSLEYLHP